MHIADLRREYMLGGLSEASVAADPFVQFERWLRDAIDANLPLANAMTLATVSAQGTPDARTVLLKGIDGGGFVFYTNYASRKGRQLEANRAGCLNFLWASIERQVRIEGSVERVSTSESEAYFASRPLGARLAAWAAVQSERVADRAALELSLSQVRARYGQNPPRPPHWGGYRLTPNAIEFWQGRENRLHDRLLYVRAAGAWTIERLAP
jgi:pyridoxamine 5'-phosphate oxidase